MAKEKKIVKVEKSEKSSGGFKLDDPVAFSNKICELMKEANE